MRITHLACAFVWLLGAAATLLAGASSVPPVRVALVTGTGADALSDLADVIAGELRYDQQIKLLERQDIHLVLAEQALNKTGSSDPARAAAVGRLLSVDVFAVLEMEPAGTGLVIYDGRSGVRLADQLIAGAVTEEQAVRACEILRGAIMKQAGVTHPVCLLTVRNADLGASMDPFCDGLGQILERDLLNSSGIAIFERRYLDQVNRERSLPTTRPATPLLPSLEFLELQVSRSATSGDFDFNVFIADSHQNRLATVNTSGSDVADAISKLTDGISHNLGVSAPQPPDVLRESAMFAKEADLFNSHWQTDSALAASEAAFALEPKDIRNQRRLARDLIEATRNSGALEVTLPQATRVFELCTNALIESKWKPIDLFDRNGVGWVFNVGYYLNGNRKAQQDPRYAADYESLRSRYHDWIVGHVRRWAAASPDAQNVQRSIPWYCADVIPALSDTTQTRADFAIELDEIVGEQWLGAYGRAHDVQWDYAGSSDFGSFVTQILKGYEPLLLDGWYGGRVPQYIQGMQGYAATIVPLYQQFAQSHDPAFQLCGQAGLSWCDAINSRLPFTAFAEKFEPIAQSAEQLLRERSIQGDARRRIYTVWEIAIEMFLGRDSNVNHFYLDEQHDREIAAMHVFRNSQGDDPANPKYPPPATTPWTSADRVCELQKTPGLENVQNLLHPMVRGDSVWALGLVAEGDKQYEQLLRIPLVESRVKPLERLNYPWWSPTDVWSQTSRSAVSDSCYWFTTNNAGLLGFPLDGSPAFFVNTNNGWPSDRVTSVACCDGYVFAGLAQGGYIVRYDPKTGRTDVLASSRRKEKRSPLDDSYAFTIPDMVADLRRHRVLFCLFQFSTRSAGIWQIDSDGVISQISGTGRLRYGQWLSEPDGDHTVCGSGPWTIDLDLRTDQYSVARELPGTSIERKTDRGPWITNAGVAPYPPCMLRDGYFWSGSAGTRTSLATGQTEVLPDVSSAVGHEHLLASEVLQSFADGRHVLAGDQRTLWMLTFNSSQSPATQP